MKRNSLCQAKWFGDSFCVWIAQVLSIKFLSLKASGVDAALALSHCVELRVTAGRLSMRRRILVIISPATLATLVGHLRGVGGIYLKNFKSNFMARFLRYSFHCKMHDQQQPHSLRGQESSGGFSPWTGGVPFAR